MSLDTSIAAISVAPALSRAPAPTVAPTPAIPPAPAVSASGAGEPPPVELPSPFGFELQIDPETNRAILEARDPITGFVVFQSPPPRSPLPLGAAARGHRVDRDI